MSVTYLNRLVREIESGKEFPPHRELRYRMAIELFAALRESEADLLKPTWWDTEYPNNTGYVIDPLAARIPGVWSDMLWGEDPQIEPAIKGDTDELEQLVDDNDLTSSLQWAEEICSSEGEVWSRLVVEPAIQSVQIEWHSRLNVIPLFIGRKLVAAAVISVLDYDTETQEEWIYIEYHTDGTVINRLYRHRYGTPLGDPVSLADQEETAQLRDTWNTGLPMLVDRVHNKLGGDWRVGISDLKGVAGLLLALNEITNIGQENARLTAKQKVVIPQRFLDAQGRLPKGAEIIIASEVDADPDKIKNDFAMIEWEFDADAIIKYKSDLTDIILTRARVAPQLVGRHTETAQTGPALRARLVDTILAGNSKGKIWDKKLPRIISLAAQLENRSPMQGGLGKGWRSPQKPPTIKRKSSLPEDEESKSRRIVTEVNAKVKSQETAVEELNPTWGPARVSEEMTRIKNEQEAAAKLAQFKNPQNPLVNNSQGEQVSDPASSTARKPGAQKPSTVPDPSRVQRT
jgi:hypothetical protein